MVYLSADRHSQKYSDDPVVTTAAIPQRRVPSDVKELPPNPLSSSQHETHHQPPLARTLRDGSDADESTTITFEISPCLARYKACMHVG